MITSQDALRCETPNLRLIVDGTRYTLSAETINKNRFKDLGSASLGCLEKVIQTYSPLNCGVFDGEFIPEDPFRGTQSWIQKR